MQNRLRAITLKGFKSIRDLSNFTLGDRAVFIGPNGAGKSNLIAFFRLLSFALSGKDGLKKHVALTGDASRYLFDGPAVTREIQAEIALGTDRGVNRYRFRLGHGAGDVFVFLEEKYVYLPNGIDESEARWTDLDEGHKEPKLADHADLVATQTPKVLLALLKRIRVYQFHNTSASARLRNSWSVTDNRYLKEDGANLGSVLYRLKNEEPGSYRRVVSTVRVALPFFRDFELEPSGDSIRLQWTEDNSDRVFDASEASDGMLRFLALVTLLRQPASGLPSVMILDEPELGLHPTAIEIVSDLIRSVSFDCQVLVATQSTDFVDQFDPQDIVVVERVDRESRFERLDPARLEAWLDEYSTSELWTKNLIGGLP